MSQNKVDKTGFLRIETHKSGHFVFQIGLDLAQLDFLKTRVNDAHIRFLSMPLISEISNELEQRVMFSSIYSTNTIEGGELSYEETVLSQKGTLIKKYIYKKYRKNVKLLIKFFRTNTYKKYFYRFSKLHRWSIFKIIGILKRFEGIK